MRWRQKRQNQVGRVRNRSLSEGQRHQTFSYYTSSQPRPEPERLTRRADSTQAQQKTSKKGLLTHLPFWLLIAVIIVCLFKFATLSTNPRIVILNQTAATKQYLQPESTYAATAAKLFKSSFANRFKLTADSDGIASRMERAFPELQTVTVTLPFMGNRPIMYLVPAKPSLFLRSTAGSVYAISSDGAVLAKLAGAPSQPLVVDESGEQIQAGHQILPKSTVGFIETVLYELSHATQPVPVAQLSLPSGSPYELDLQIKGKPYTVRFNLQEDARQQAGSLLATLHSLGSATPGSYIDVRVPGRVYYK